MDAAVEFPPHHCNLTKGDRAGLPVFNDFHRQIYDYRKIAENLLNYRAGSFTLFRGVMPGWDNTARRQRQGTISVHSDPQLYCRWLHRAVLRTRRHANPDERLIFFNSCNEWAEGAHLEPDERYGNGWLNATRLALETRDSRQNATCNSDGPYRAGHQPRCRLGGRSNAIAESCSSGKKRRPFAVKVICVGSGELRKEFEESFPTLVLGDFTPRRNGTTRSPNF
jgi:hypothetical protein